jgi:hypothetical protein
LRFAREKAGFATAKEAAEAMGAPVSTYIGHENGGRGFPATKAQRYASFFRVTPEWLLYGRGTGPAGAAASPVKRDERLIPVFLPVRYRVQAGTWYENDGYAQTFVQEHSYPVMPDPRFADWPQWLEEVHGDSANLRVPDGYLAHVVDAVEMGYAVKDGDWVVVERRRAGGALRERTIKQVAVKNGAIELWPRSTNPKWSDPLTILPDRHDEDVEVEIVGLVIGAYAAFR